MNLIKEISNEIQRILNCNIDIKKFIDISSDIDKGEFVFKAFKVSQLLKMSPEVIALKIQKGVCLSFVNNIEVINGYVNFYIDKNIYIKDSLMEIIQDNNNYGVNINTLKNKFINTHKYIESHNYMRQLSKFALYNFIDNIFICKGDNVTKLNNIYVNNILDHNMLEYINKIMRILAKTHIVYKENNCLCVNLKEYNNSPFILKKNEEFTDEAIILFNALYYIEKNRSFICIYDECYHNLYNKIDIIIRIVNEKIYCKYFFISNYIINIINNRMFRNTSVDINSIAFYILSHKMNEKVFIDYKFTNHNINKYYEIRNCINNADNYLNIYENSHFTEEENTIDIYNEVRVLCSYSNVLNKVMNEVDSSILCGYIIKVCDNLSKAIKTKKVDSNIVLLVKASLNVIKRGLLILGIDVS